MKNEDLFDKREYYNSLYDVYKNLLTQKQRDYFEAYFFDDMSLSEIADLNKVSRNAIFVSIKAIQVSLNEYEEKLYLYKKRNKVLDLIDQYEEFNNEDIKEIIKKLKEMEL